MKVLRLVMLASAAGFACFTNCRSLEGLSGGEPSDSGTVAETGPDAPTPAVCEPTAGTGTACVTVKLDPAAASPPYSAFTGAGVVKADGNGFLQVLLFDKDPTDPINGHVLPKATLRYPPTAGETTTIDRLPLELIGTALPGTYFVFAFFLDNDLDARGTGLLAKLPGDFITQKTIGAESLYPKVTLVAGEVSKLEIPLVPFRALTLNCRAGVALLQAAATNSTIHGDGPGSFYLYDGDLTMGAPTIVDFGEAACIDMQLQNPSRPDTVPATFGTTTTGTHNLYGNVYDYQNPTIESFDVPPGSLQSDAANPPVVTIDPLKWTAIADFIFTSVYQPKTPPASDPLTCN